MNSIFVLTFIVLLILKATAIVTWSWWIIFSPLLILLTVWLIIGCLVVWALCKSDNFWGI